MSITTSAAKPSSRRAWANSSAGHEPRGPPAGNLSNTVRAIAHPLSITCSNDTRSGVLRPGRASLRTVRRSGSPSDATEAQQPGHSCVPDRTPACSPGFPWHADAGKPLGATEEGEP
ncbi:hypothetical protein GCM10010274_38270 [Streptomyces lavendofoliae]|uniref:Uncharacterized protein n=1 Tax=Streptomyces lavendofoliae TaxID=67314 RepID=A0A918HZ68_9ACTN|nr:hypothetical protein GCM10010274_38270 [Streptomyces lavendofoliae]